MIGTIFSLKLTASWQQICCNSTNEPYKKSSVSGKIDITVAKFDCPIPGLSVPLPGLTDYAQLGVYAGFSAKGTITGSVGVAQPCQTAPVCVNVGVDVSISVTAKAVLNTPGGYASCGLSVAGSCSASVSTSGPDADGNCKVSGNVGQCKVTGEVWLTMVGFCTKKSTSATVWNGIPIGPYYPTGCMYFTPPS
jgi:hypothetical protein